MKTSITEVNSTVNLRVLVASGILVLALSVCTSAAVPVAPRSADDNNFSANIHRFIVATLENSADDQHAVPMVFDNSDYANFVQQTCDLVAYAEIALTVLAANRTAGDEALLIDYHEQLSTIANNTCVWAKLSPHVHMVDPAANTEPCTPENMYRRCFSMRIRSLGNTAVNDALKASAIVTLLQS